MKLSVCIPTRNRQKYCIETIKSLAKSEQDDFEVIIGDNSDDPNILADYFKTFTDKRFKLVPPGERVFSMVENWDRLIPFTCGEWVSYIGDDDYIDPDVTRLIAGIEKAVPHVEAVDWNAINFIWPQIQPKDWMFSFPTGSDVTMVNRRTCLENMFYWKNAKDRPVCAFGIYHGALKRTCIEKIKDTFSGKYFEHQTVDYESICKAIMVADAMVFCARPMSVMGACKDSNSAAVIDPKLIDARAEAFRKETKASSQGLLTAKNFPFDENMGLTAAAGAAILWFVQKYELDVKGWEENFIKACSKFVENIDDEDDFKTVKKMYLKSVRSWKAGKYLKHFEPKFQNKKSGKGVVFQGKHEGKIYISPKIADIHTPGEYYEYSKYFLQPLDLVLYRMNQPEKKAA